MSKKHMGSSIDDFLKEEGIFEEAQAEAVKEVVAWQLAEAKAKSTLRARNSPPLRNRRAPRICLDSPAAFRADTEPLS